MQAVLGGEMQGLLYVSDLYLSCILIVTHLSMYAPPRPPGGEVGEGTHLVNSPIHWQDGGVLCLYIEQKWQMPHPTHFMGHEFIGYLPTLLPSSSHEDRMGCTIDRCIR